LVNQEPEVDVVQLAIKNNCHTKLQSFTDALVVAMKTNGVKQLEHGMDGPCPTQIILWESRRNFHADGDVGGSLPFVMVLA